MTNKLNLPSIVESFRLFFENDQRRPIYHRYLLTAILCSLVVIVSILFLPSRYPLTAFQKVITAVVMVISFIVVLTIVTDTNKPLFLQILFALFFIGEIASLVVFYSGVDYGSFSHAFFNKSVMKGQWTLILDGVKMTLKLSFFSIIYSTVFGLILAILRQIKNKVISAVIVGYLNFFRIIPSIVFLMFIYYGLPYANIVLSPFVCGVVALSMGGGAYISEVFRAGIEAIHHTQIEASRALGLSFGQSMRLVILPQSIKIVLPSLSNQWIGTLKDTAICSMISVTELLKAGQIIATWKANTTPLIISAGVYLLILIPLTILVNKLENNSKRQVIKNA